MKYHLALCRERDGVHVLRCFDCDWGMSFADRDDAIEAKGQHARRETIEPALALRQVG